MRPSSRAVDAIRRGKATLEPRNLDVNLPMQEYRFLIPECLDGTNVPQPGFRFEKLKQGLVKLANGYTTHRVEGAWKNNDETTCEPCRQFIVAISDEQRLLLFAMIHACREKFYQQAIYVANGEHSWLIDHTYQPDPNAKRQARDLLQL